MALFKQSSRGTGSIGEGIYAKHDEYLPAETVALPLAGSGERIVLAQPSGIGPAQRRLDDADEGVCAVAVAVAERRVAEDVLQDKGVGNTGIGDTIWTDERATLGVSLALVSAQ